MKKKYIGAGVALFCVLAVALSAIWLHSRPAAEAGGKAITVEVVHADGSQAEFSYQTDKEYLGELLLEEGLISGSESSYGLFVDTVDGETADYEKDGGWWRLTCNGEDSQTGVDTTVIHDGDVFAWIYTVG